MSEIKNYLKYVNHSRDQSFPFGLQEASKKPANHGEPSIYLYSLYRESNIEKPVLLLQGDSWAEGLERHSANEFLQIAEKKNLRFMSGGTKSFSPSNMAAQLQHLKDQGIEIKETISFIDQTDLGDEHCRYRKHILFSQTRPEVVEKVEPFSLTGKSVFEYGPLVLMSDNVFMLPGLIAEAGYRIRRFASSLANDKHCTWGDIEKSMLQEDPERVLYFKRVLRAYLNTHKRLYPDGSLTLVTHPHLRHLNNAYRYDISNTVSQIASEYKWVNHLDLKLQLLGGVIADDLATNSIFQQEDLASHPTPRGYKLIARRIKSFMLSGKVGEKNGFQQIN